MKFIGKYVWAIMLMAVLVTACGDKSGSNILEPSTTSASQAPASSSETPTVTVPPTPPAPGANATTPVYTMSGTLTHTCIDAVAGMNPLQWILNMTDAGPSDLRFVALTHQDPDPNCLPTAREARPRIDIDGVKDYKPHTRGRTTFTFDPKMYDCGRVQADVSIFDASGKEILIVAVMVRYSKKCEPPPPPPVTPASTCSATVTPARVVVGEWATIRVVTTNSTRLMMGEEEVVNFTDGVGTVTVQAQQSMIGTRQYNFRAVGRGAPGTCSTTLVVEPVAPTQCTLTATAVWDPERSAVRYRLSVTPQSPGQAMAGFVVDGNTQNPSPVDIDRDLFFGFIGDSRTHNWMLNASYNPGNGGPSCTAQASVVIPQSQNCEVLNPPRFDTPIWTSMDQASRNSIVAATVNVYNGATWKFVLMARNSRTGEQWTKDIAERTVACGEQKTLGVSFDWTDHPADKWWTVLYKNGVSVYTSPQITRSDN